MNKILTLLLITVLCLSSCSAQYRHHKLEKFSKNLNDSVKAVFASVLNTIDEAEYSSDEVTNDEKYNLRARKTVSDTSDEDLDIASIFADIKETALEKIMPKADKILNKAFGEGNRFWEGLMEQVMVNMEDIHDHASRFMMMHDHLNISAEGVKDKMKDFPSAVLGIIDNILDGRDKHEHQEGKIADRVIKKWAFEATEGESPQEPVWEKKEEMKKDKNMFNLMDGIRTITFIKNNLKNKWGGEDKRAQKSGEKPAEKTYRRQNALRFEDFEKLFA